MLNYFNKTPFDYIICADMLGRFLSPWRIPADQVASIKPDRQLVESIPNVRHWSIWVPMILKGRWESCIDQTQLHLFTQATSEVLTIGANLDVNGCQPTAWLNSENMLISIVFGMLERLLASHWVTLGKADQRYPNE